MALEKVSNPLNNLEFWLDEEKRALSVFYRDTVIFEKRCETTVEFHFIRYCISMNVNYNESSALKRIKFVT